MRRSLAPLLATLGLLLVLFLSVPLLKLLLDVGGDRLLATLKDGTVLGAILLTMKLALYATVIVLLTGIPLAYLIARHDFPGKAAQEPLLDLPVMVPHTAAGIALLGTFGSEGISQFLERIGLGFVDAETGIVAAMTFLSAPFLINGAKEGFLAVDPRLERAALTLGATPWQAFRYVALPNARRAIVNGALMMWSRGIGEFGAVVIIAYHPMTAPVLIYDRFTQYGLKESAPVAAVMILLSLMVFLTIRVWNNRK
jgi:molybdate/tungstate transport system permease protein